MFPETFLGDYNGYLQTDGYPAYDGLFKMKHLGCLAHARRKFMDAKKLQGKGKTGKADVALAKPEPDIDSLLPWNLSH